MVELLAACGGRDAASLVVRKHLDSARLAHQVRWLTRAQGPGVVRLRDIGRGADHYSTDFGGPRTLAGAATEPESTLPIVIDVWSVLERLHRLGLVHGAVAADHVVVGPGGPLLLSPGGPDGVDRDTDVADFGCMVGGLAEVWSTAGVVGRSVTVRWIAVGRAITELAGPPDRPAGARLVSGAEVRRLLAELGANDRSRRRFAGGWFRTRRRYGSDRGRRGGRLRNRS